MELSEKELSSILKNWDDTDNPLKDTYTIKVKDVSKIGENDKK